MIFTNLMVMVFVFICGSAIAEIVPTNDETNVPFLVGMVVLLCVLFVILVFLVALLCYRRSSRLDKKKSLIGSDNCLPISIRTDGVRPSTSPPVAMVGDEPSRATGTKGAAGVGGVAGCAAHNLANYLSMDEHQLCEMASREAAASAKHERVGGETNATSNRRRASDSDISGVSPSASLRSSSLRDCDILKLERNSGPTPLPDDISGRDGVPPLEKQLDLEDGRCSVLKSTRRGSEVISGWTTSGEITTLDPRSKPFWLPPPPLTTPPRTPSDGRCTPPFASDDEDDGMKDNEVERDEEEEQYRNDEIIDQKQTKSLLKHGDSEFLKHISSPASRSLPKSVVSASVNMSPLAPPSGLAKYRNATSENAESLDHSLDHMYDQSLDTSLDHSLDPEWSKCRNVDLSIDLEAVQSQGENTNLRVEIKKHKDKKHRKSRKKHHSRSKQNDDMSKDFPDENIKDLVTSYKRTHLKSLDGASIDFSK